MRLDSNFRARVQKGLVLLMSVLAIMSLLFSAYAVFTERHRIASGYGDYVIYYTGAQMIRGGDSSHLYDLSYQWKYQKHFAAPIRAGALPFNHPAYELLWHIPFTYLSYVSAYVVWNLINAGLLFGLARWFVPSDQVSLKWLLLIMSFSFYPVFAAFLHGQDSILLTFLIGASIMALKRKKLIAAGVLLALASFKPQIVIPIALTWMHRPFRKAAAAWLVGASLLAILSISMVGMAGTEKYLELLVWIDRTHYTIDPLAMPNLRGLVYLLAGGQYSDLVFPLTMVVTLGVIVYLVSQWRRVSFENDNDFDCTVALTLTLTSLTSYHAYTHDFTLLLLPALIVTRGFLTGGGLPGVTMFLGVVLLILWLPFPITYGQLLEHGKLPWLSLLFLVFALLLAIRLQTIRATPSPSV